MRNTPLQKKLHTQQLAAAETRAHIEALRNRFPIGKDSTADAVIAQAEIKLRRQLDAVRRTEWELKNTDTTDPLQVELSSLETATPTKTKAR